MGAKYVDRHAGDSGIRDLFAVCRWSDAGVLMPRRGGFGGGRGFGEGVWGV
jgi:hypothetical protein